MRPGAVSAELLAFLRSGVVFSRGPSGEKRDAGTRGRGWRLFACASCFVVPFALATHEGPPPAGETIVEDAIHGAPSDRWIPFLPFLTTNAEREREREASSPGARPVFPAAAASSGDGSPRGTPAVASSPRSEGQSLPRATMSDREAAARHLAAVHRALFVQHDRQAARRLLNLYELTFVDDPFPGRHAALASQLSAP